MEIDSSFGGKNECILNVFEHHVPHCVVFEPMKRSISNKFRSTLEALIGQIFRQRLSPKVKFLP